MSLTVEQFLERLESSNVLDTAALNSVRSGVSEDDLQSDAEPFVKQLHKQKTLTNYQVQALWKGKGHKLTFGNYVIESELGRGGMGVVLKARHKRMQRNVAIKVLPAAMVKDGDAIARFQREVVAAAQLTHTNIVGAHDADEVNGQHILVMEYVDGRDLSEVVKKKGPLKVAQAVDYMTQAARGLEFAHRQGVIHRDIKPANLLLATDGTVKILDMGLARMAESADVGTQAELTGTGTVMGTVDYMSPEQAMSTKSADERSDIYSLGISLYYLLTGKPAYEGDSLMARLMAHANQPIPSLQDARPDVPEGVQQVFAKMVAKEPTERYQTMTEVIAALEASLSDAAAPDATANPAAFAETGTVGRSELSEFLSGIEASSTASDISVTATRVTSDEAENTLITGGGTSDTLLSGLPPATQTKRKRGRRKKQPKWYEDKRIIGGATAIVVLLLGLFLTSGDDEPDNVAATDSTSVAAPPVSESKGSSDSVTEAPATSGATSPTEVPAALKFTRPSEKVVVDAVPLDFKRPFTVEGWFQLGDFLRLDTPKNAAIRPMVELGPLQFRLQREDSVQVSLFGELTSSEGRAYEQHTAWLPEQFEKLRSERSHLAAVYTGTEMQIYLNGERVDVARSAGRYVADRKLPSDLSPEEHLKGLFATWANDNALWIGAGHLRDPNTFASLEGTVSSIRISQSAVYTSQFTPKLLAKTPSTVALYDFREGSGDILHDVSGNGHDGKIVGAEWVDSTSTIATRSTITPADGWVDLLALADADKDVASGEWSMLNSALSCQSNDHAMFTFPIKPVGNYELKATLLRPKSAAVALPIDGLFQTALVLDLYNESPRVSGLERVKLADANSALNLSRTSAWPSKTAPYELSVRVERVGADSVHITADLSGTQLVDWQGPMRDLTERETWAVVDSGRIGIGGWRAPLDVTQLSLRMLSGEAKVVPSLKEHRESNDQASVAAKSSSSDSAPWLDLTDKINLAADTVEGSWRRIGEGFLSGNSPARLRLPVRTDGDFECRIDLTAHGDWPNLLGVAMPCGDERTTLTLESATSQRMSMAGWGLPLESPGKNGAAIPLSESLFKPNKRQSAYFRVRRNGDNVSLYSELNGQTFHVFDGPVSSLNLAPDYRLMSGEADEIVITARKTSVTIHKVEWRQLSGDTDWIRPSAGSTPDLQRSRSPKIVDTPTGAALKLVPGEGVVIDSLVDNTESLTMEFWLRSEKPNSNIYLLGSAHKYGIRFGSTGQIALKGVKSSVPDRYELGKPDQFPPREMIHVAVVRDAQNKQHRLYVDGQLNESVDTISPPTRDHFQVAGTERQYASQKGLGFDGLIDEIRISKSVRYQDDRFTPKRRFEPDEQTLALYHCDSLKTDQLVDASGNGHHGKIIGAKWFSSDEITPSQSKGADANRIGPTADVREHGLRFLNKSDAVVTDPINIDATSPLTIEAWVTLGPKRVDEHTPNGNMYRIATLGPFALRLRNERDNAGDSVVVTVAGIEKQHHPFAIFKQAFDWQEGITHHLALMWDGTDIQIAVDGHLGVAERRPSDRNGRSIDEVMDIVRKDIAQNAEEKYLAIGNRHPRTEKTDQMSGIIHQVRVSVGNRYAKSFEPAPLENDSQTLALYHFNEGNGEILRDLSGNAYHGTVTGAEWTVTRQATD